ncbi:hypothetical protein [Paraburkholderia sp.]|uniref:hypothetical protein n=1 Tax=Paraburkholderia sp. TaxID=1926495 RepID=UPI0023918C0F|nr:hypothetical protein [Paraburkholderia sp.]MDE1179768.1 hypothetical protein [Paraburkholderia sp.]
MRFHTLENDCPAADVPASLLAADSDETRAVGAASAADGDAAKPVRALSMITFGFAWLFGLEPFLSSGDPFPARRRNDIH